MDKLTTLISICKAGVHETGNQHKDYYETIAFYLDQNDRKEDVCHPQEEVYSTMIKTDTMIRAQFYPDTPIGSFILYHYDLDKLLDQCLEIMKEEATK